MQLIVTTDRDPLALAAAARAEVRALDSMTAVTKVSTVAAELGQSLAARRFQSLLLVLFAALALVLAAVWVFDLIKGGPSHS
jgi:hypothetical protein